MNTRTKSTEAEATQALMGIAQERRALEARTVTAVAELRRAGASWAKVGTVLGITRQAAWERFSPRPTTGS
jgi:hypothetical protein